MLRRRPTAVLLAAACLVGGSVVASQSATATTALQSYSIGSQSTITVIGHGNGHGHGMSQYGAYGAALAGLTVPQILAFYYPNTALTTLSPVPTLRVQLSGGYANTCLQAAAGLTSTAASAALPSSGSLQIAPSGAGLSLLSFTTARCSGTAKTVALKVSAPTAIDVKSTAGYVRLLRADGTSTDYYGTIGAARSGTGEVTINKVDLDHYAQGVAPRESPQYWGPVAGGAQAVAARTYAEYEREHAPAGSHADICDTSSCQVYGGKTHYDASGNVLWQDYPAAVSGTSTVPGNQGRVLTYQGKAAFTQYSASNGGWTVDGGQPYLVAKQDPYDNAKSGDPYLNWTVQVPVSRLTGYYGLKTVSAVRIMQRDGHGDMGGRVLQAYVDGTNLSGAPVSVASDGSNLQYALGTSDRWFVFSLPRTVAAQPTVNYSKYVTTVYRVMFGRAPSAGELREWDRRLSSGTSTATLATDAGVSTPALIREVLNLWSGAVHQRLSGASLATAVSHLKSWGYNALAARVFGSDAFYKLAGRTPSGFVRALYANALVTGKAPSAATLRSWVNQLKRGVPRSNVAAAVLRSSAVQQARLAQTALLGSTLTGAAMTRWTSFWGKAKCDPTKLRILAFSDPVTLKALGVTH